MPYILRLLAVFSLFVLPLSSISRCETTLLGDLEFTAGLTGTHFDTVYDLTEVDVSVSYSVDLSEVQKDKVELGPFLEVGLREKNAADFNPGEFGVHTGGKGGWMISAVGDLATDPDSFDVDDKHNLQSAGDLDEAKYDATSRNTVLSESFGNLTNGTGIYFDRDGAGVGEEATQAGTAGVYSIVVDFHALSDQQATMFATVNGISQGFVSEESGLFSLAGVSFTGDMTEMQVFAGGLMGDSTGRISLRDLVVTTTPLSSVPEPCSIVLLIGMAAFLPRLSRH